MIEGSLFHVIMAYYHSLLVPKPGFLKTTGPLVVSIIHINALKGMATWQASQSEMQAHIKLPYQNRIKKKNKKTTDVCTVANWKQWRAAIFRLSDITQP